MQLTYDEFLDISDIKKFLQKEQVSLYQGGFTKSVTLKKRWNS